MRLRLKWLLIGYVLGIVTYAGGAWWLRGPAPAPPTVEDRAALTGAGYVTVPEGPVADDRPELPGTPVARLTLTMPRRGPRVGRGAPTPGLGPPGGASIPGPGADSGAIPPPPPEEPPVPVPAGLTADDISGEARVALRVVGRELFSRADLTCCAGPVCRVQEGAETLAGWDRAALCPRRPALGRLLTLGVGLGLPDPAIIAQGAFYPQGRRIGYWGQAVYILDPAVSETVRPSGEYSYSVISEAGRAWQVAGGVSVRIGG